MFARTTTSCARARFFSLISQSAGTFTPCRRTRLRSSSVPRPPVPTIPIRMIFGSPGFCCWASALPAATAARVPACSTSRRLYVSLMIASSSSNCTRRPAGARGPLRLPGRDGTRAHFGRVHRPRPSRDGCTPVTALLSLSLFDVKLLGCLPLALGEVGELHRDAAAGNRFLGQRRDHAAGYRIINIVVGHPSGTQRRHQPLPVHRRHGTASAVSAQGRLPWLGCVGLQG